MSRKRIDLTRIRTRSMAQRKSKVERLQFANELSVSGTGEFLDSLPDILKARDLKRLLERLLAAKQKQKPIIWMFGAHLLKVGLGPLLCDIIRSGFAQQISANNAALIHDLELAFFGATSEDVEAELAAGEFGMTEETARLYAQVTNTASVRSCGLGEAAGVVIGKEAKYAENSVFAAAQAVDIPATIHAAIGTDIVNCHPSYDGAEVGHASQIDFEIFCHTVTQLKDGGVVLNIGSAVIMPEVFLKGIAVARNLDAGFGKFTAANFDMINHYRPRQDIINRPRLLGAESYDFCGHHEIMLPLLWASLKDKLQTTRE